MFVRQLTDKDEADIEIFCLKCKEAGYQNNQSLKDLKWGDIYDLPSKPEFWAVYERNEIISIAGCHKFQFEGKTLRCLFRAASIPSYQHQSKSLSRNHINSLSKLILPLQIQYGLENDYDDFILTTNKSNDSSGKMLKTHRVYEYLAKNKIVEYLGDMEYYGTLQSIWKITIERYLNFSSDSI
jgi:hypothetical protein